MPRRERIIALTVALGGLAFAFAAVALWAPGIATELLELLPVAFTSAGTFLPVWGLSQNSTLGPYELAIFVWTIDTTKTVLVVYSFDLIRSFGPAGRFVVRQRARAAKLIASRPALRRASIGGLTLFVLVPLPGTGATPGTLLGILLGMRRRAVVTAVSVGSGVGAAAVAVAALHYGHILDGFVHAHTDPFYRYPIIGAVFVAAIAGWVSTRRA